MNNKANNDTIKIIVPKCNVHMSCRNCGDTNWIVHENGFKCAACGDISRMRDMIPQEDK